MFASSIPKDEKEQSYSDTLTPSPLIDMREY